VYNPPQVPFPRVLTIVIAIDPCGAGKNWRKVTIEVLPDDALLEIFDFYRLYAMRRSSQRRWKWLRLAHVCRRWRHVIFTSPRRLDLQILCKSSKPIEPVLCVWPTLPVVVQFKGRPKSKSLPKNVVVALRQTDRVCKIDLSVPTPISQPIADMMRDLLRVPFSALEFIRIESKNTTEPLAIDDFLGGSAPRLKEIRVEGIATPFLSLRRLLLSTHNLITLNLYGIPEFSSFPPGALATILSSLDHLKELSIHFRPPASRSTTNMEPPLERSTFPSLISFDFYGASKYLEAFVARAHMPVLDRLTTRFFNQAIFEIPHFFGFLSRLEGFKVLRGVELILHEKSVIVEFREKGSLRIKWHLSIQCRQLDWQLSLITQIFNQLSPLFSSANQLMIFGTIGSGPTGNVDVDPARWLEFFQSLPHFSRVLVNNHELVPDILHALVNEDMAAGVLPSLTLLQLSGYRRSESTIDAAERFVGTRKLANHNIVLRG